MREGERGAAEHDGCAHRQSTCTNDRHCSVLPVCPASDGPVSQPQRTRGTGLLPARSRTHFVRRHSRLREPTLAGGALEKKILHIPRQGFPTLQSARGAAAALIAAAVG